METTTKKVELIENIINNNGNITQWNWDNMGVFDMNYFSDKFSGNEIYKKKNDESFMRDVARDFFKGFGSINEIIAFCKNNGFKIF